MADLENIDNVAPADSLKVGADRVNLIRARVDGLYTALSDITAAEANQVENIGATTISAAQWAYLGELDQSLLTTASPTFAGLTLTGGFTLGGILTLAGNVVCDDYAFTGVGDMTFTAGSILASGSTNTNTLLLKANDTTCITLTTAATDTMDLAAVNSLAAIANLDIGSYTFTCAGLIDDTLTSGRVVFASTGGLLADDADLTFATATLSATNVTSTGTVTVAALTATANLDIGAYTFRCNGLIDDSLTSGRVVLTTTNGQLATDSDITFDTATLTVTNIAAFNLTGKLTAGASEIEGSNFDINGGDISAVTVSGDLTWSTAQTINIDDITGTTEVTVNDAGADLDFRVEGIGVANALLVQGSDGFVGIGLAAPTASLHVRNIEDNANVAIFNLEGRRPTPANNDTIYIYYRLNNSNSASFEYARTTITAEDITLGSEEGSLLFEVARGGSLETVLKMSATEIVLNEPGADRDLRIEASGQANAFFLQGSDGAVSMAVSLSVPTISITGELDITGASGCIDLNPAFQTTKNIIDLTPTATINATQIWCGFYINGAALDPNGVDVEIIGNSVDFSGVSETNSPIIHGTKLKVPFRQDALHIEEGQIHIDTVLPSTAAAEFTNIDIVIDSSALVSTSEYHAIDVSTTGTPAGTVAALGIYFGVDPIRQYISTFATPSQTEFAGVKHTGGTVWADGIDAYGVIFAAVSDAIYVGSATQFDEIEVIMTTGGTKSIQPTFWYNTAADTWTEFFPADDTDGFQQSGEIRWPLASISATWTNDGDPGGADTTAGYWIKIVRTRAGTVGSPDPATVKIALATKYNWDKTGALSVLSIAVPTITAVTTLTAGGNLDIGAYDFRAATLTADSLTSGRVPFASTNGLLIDDADFTFATDTLTVTKIGAFEATGAINFGNQAMTNVDINSGAIDGVIIGAASAAALTCTTFTSTGIDDNADAVAITISSAEVVSLGAAKLTVGTTTLSATQWGALGALVEWTNWTPTLTGDADLSGYTSARYYRIGDACFFEFSADNKNVTTSGVIQITLPFTHANTGAATFTANVHDGTTWIGQPNLELAKNLGYISIWKTAAGGTWAGTETGIYIRITGTFEIA